MNFPKPIVAIDLETTGLNAREGAEICQIGAVIIDPRTLEELESFCEIIKPGCEYRSPQAMSVHGIPEELLQKADTFPVVIQKFERWLGRFVARRFGFRQRPLRQVILAAWGTYFDITFLEAMYKKYNLEYPYHHRVLDFKAVSIWEFAKNNNGDGGKGLAKVGERLQIPFEGRRHDALADIRQSMKIIRKLAGIREV